MIRSNEKLKLCAYELRYYQAILAFGDPNHLLDLKADLVMNKRVRYPQGLKIVDSYGFDWVLDIPFDKKRASKFIANGIFCGEAFVSEDFYENYGLAKKIKEVESVV